MKYWLCILMFLATAGCAHNKYNIHMTEPPTKINKQTGECWMLINMYWVKVKDVDFEKLKIEVEDNDIKL
jgi:hypothetical protein